MLALDLPMNTAYEINFLDNQFLNQESDAPTIYSKWFRMFGDQSKTEINHNDMMAVDGGFVFNHEQPFAIPAKLSSGILGTAMFLLVGGLISTGTINTSVLVRAFDSTKNSLQASALTAISSNTKIVPNGDQVYTKSNKSTSTTSTVGTSVTNPLSGPAQPVSKLNREVFGFLPYWFVDSAADNLDYSLLSTLAYFDIPINADGSLDTLSNGWKKMHSDTTQNIFKLAQEKGTRVVLTYSAFDSHHIENVSTNEQARNSAVNNMVNLAKSQGAQGANIDFEYIGDPRPEVRQGFTKFVQQATERFHTEIPGSKVTVSMYAISAKMEKLYQVDALADASDGLFIMAYDFYTAGSSNAGPIAPLTGAPNTYWYDVTSSVNDFISAGVPQEKMILGVPYYGYDWPTVDHSPKSQVLPGSKNTANYSGVQRVLAAGEGERRWDYEAQVPYLVYQEDGVNRIAYYDDAESLAKKYDLINSRNLQGVGIWALGQDGDHQELWSLLKTKFVHE